MAHRLETGIKGASAVVLAASMALGASSCVDKFALAGKNDKDPHYVYAGQVDNANNLLSSAQGELDYHPPYTTYITVSCGKNCSTTVPVYHSAVYPNSKDAKTDIKTAAVKLHYEDNQIASEMLHVGGKLPDQNNLQSYQGHNVNDSTFQSERDELGKIRNELGSLADAQRKSNPELKRENDGADARAINATFGIFGGLSLLGLSYVLRWRREERESDTTYR